VSSMLTSAAVNRQHIFDDDVLHSLLTKIDELNDTGCILFSLFLVNRYGKKVVFFLAVRIRNNEINRISAERIFHALHIETERQSK
jgi:hypothetical protein